MVNDTQPQPGNCSITPVDGHHGNFKLTEECLTVSATVCRRLVLTFYEVTIKNQSCGKHYITNGFSI